MALITQEYTIVEGGDTASGRTGETFYGNALLTSNSYGAGIRFQNIELPKDGEIVSAILDFRQQSRDAYSIPSTKQVSRIYYEDSDNPLIFSTSSPPYGRDRSVSYVEHEWDLDLYKESVTGQVIAQIDVTDLVDEIIARDGWVSGNSLAFIEKQGTGDTSGYISAGMKPLTSFHFK